MAKKKKSAENGSRGAGAGAAPTPLSEHAAFFDMLVELIPARYISDHTDRVDLRHLKKSERRALKKEARRAGADSKRQRLDPDATEERIARQQQKQFERGIGVSLVVGGPQLSREELQARLQQRVEEIRAQQRQASKDGIKRLAALSPADRAREWRERQLARAGARAAAGAEEGGVSDPGSDSAGGGGSEGAGAGDAAEEEELAFGRVEGGEGAGAKRKRVSKAAALSKAEAKRAKLQELEGTEEGAALRRQQALQAAMARVKGERVLDDPKLIRKALKREQKQKQKSAKAWAERNKAAEAARKEQQQKRSDNLTARKKAKAERRIAKREKKLMRPGFEGRRGSTVN
ncbi:unnamed protein product [Pedinophyceae sp. YPF-701]|nr:unnamed protein product [Pedinophyceae sp. YPF-701]